MIANALSTKSKDDVRKEFKDRRSKVTGQEKDWAAEAILKHFGRMRSGIAWLLYAPLPDEFPTHKIFELAKNRHDKVFFPKVKESFMSFYEAETWDQLKPGAFGLEPPTYNPEWTPLIPSIIVIPGIAFDRSGMRLGFGKGYYDKFLSLNKRFPRLAVAFDCQIASQTQWKVEEHDQRMDYVLTPNAVWGSPRILM